MGYVYERRKGSPASAGDHLGGSDWSPERIRAYCARRGWQVEAIWPELRGWIGSLPEVPTVPLAEFDRGGIY
jgi:hypothetical protein